MVQKESYGFNTFGAARVGEIQQNTNPKEWFWMESKYNIADWLTRGKKPNGINLDSAWQNGPSFLELPESEWPIHKTITKEQLPELIKIAYTITKHFNKDDKDTLASRININRHSDIVKCNQSDSQNFDDVPKKTEIIRQTRRTVTNSK